MFLRLWFGTDCFMVLLAGCPQKEAVSIQGNAVFGDIKLIYRKEKASYLSYITGRRPEWTMLGHCSAQFLCSALVLQVHCNCTELPMQSERWHFTELLTPVNTFAPCCQRPWPSIIPGSEAVKLMGGCCDQQGEGTQRSDSFPAFNILMFCFTFSWKSTFWNTQCLGVLILFLIFFFWFFFSHPYSCFSYQTSPWASITTKEDPCCASGFNLF